MPRPETPPLDSPVPTARLAAALTAASIRRPAWTIAGLGVAIGWIAFAAPRAPGEVGYAAYFGPDSAELAHLNAFLEEFESGVHLVVVFGCRETTRCRSIAEPFALDLLGRLHAALDRLPNVRHTW